MAIMKDETKCPLMVTVSNAWDRFPIRLLVGTEAESGNSE